MANVLLSWTAPSVTTNVDGIVVLRMADPGSAPGCDDFIAANKVRSNSGTAANDTGLDLQTGVTQVGTDLAVSDVSVVDSSVSAGDYYYAAFSYNAAGYSPCTVTGSALNIT
jgi:hypothetical protein